MCTLLIGRIHTDEKTTITFVHHSFGCKWQVSENRLHSNCKVQARTDVWIPSRISQIADVKRFSNSFGKTPTGETACKKHSRNRLLGQFKFSATFLPALTEYSYTDDGRRRDGVGDGSGPVVVVVGAGGGGGEAMRAL